jgi:circadian clock protein KaiB
MNDILLKLYIAGNTEQSQRAVKNLRQLIDEEWKGSCKMVIIDILEQPQTAEDEKILATPTLVREMPLPVRILVGDLSNHDLVKSALNITTQNAC